MKPRRISTLSPPGRPVVCVGIDLAGVPHRETGVAILRDGRLMRLYTAWDDVEIVRAVMRPGRRATVAINAPLTRPLGRCCLDDECPCRDDPGTRSRLLERELGLVDPRGGELPTPLG